MWSLIRKECTSLTQSSVIAATIEEDGVETANEIFNKHGLTSNEGKTKPLTKRNRGDPPRKASSKFNKESCTQFHDQQYSLQIDILRQLDSL